MELEPARGRRAVDPLAQTDEGHAHDVQFVQERHQVAEVPAQPVQPPADQHIELPTLGVPDQGVQGRSAILGSGEPLSTYSIAVQLRAVTYWRSSRAGSPVPGRTSRRGRRWRHGAEASCDSRRLRQVKSTH